MANPLFILSLLLCFHLAACQQVETPSTAPATSFTPLAPIKAALPQKPLFISTDYGENWVDVSYNLPDDVQVSFLEQKGEELVLASDNLGVFLSSENRTQWTAIGATLPSKKINALHIVGEAIYVGVYRNGIFKTTDDGRSWQALNENLPNLNVQAIFQSGQRLLVGTDGGLFFLDPNSNWQATNINNQVLSIYEHDNVLVAGTQRGTALSQTRGTSWEWIREEGAVHYTHPIDSRIVELMINGELVYSDDQGNSWTSIYYGPNGDSYIYEIIAAGDYQLISNNYGVHRSSDNGQSWKLIYPIETLAFFDFFVTGDTIYGGTRVWDEFRGREGN